MQDQGSERRLRLVHCRQCTDFRSTGGTLDCSLVIYKYSYDQYFDWLECASSIRDRVVSDRRHVRRLLSPEEAARVVQAAASGPDAGGRTGPDRAVLYHLALGTGFRRKELATLTPERFTA